MYNFKISGQAKSQINSLLYPSAKDAIIKRIGELQENPFNISKSTNKPSIGNYYINCGNKYCVTFNIDEESKSILIIQVVLRPYLYKILIGRI